MAMMALRHAPLRLVDEMIPKETASEKSAAEGWKARGKRLLNWVNNKEEDEQQ